METKKFQQTIENFACLHCGAKVKGTGYTNHCPKCLYSLHIDINPGDRAQNCGGLMPPVGLEMSKNKYIILHRCEKCGVERKNHTADNDSIDALIKLNETFTRGIHYGSS